MNRVGILAALAVSSVVGLLTAGVTLAADAPAGGDARGLAIDGNVHVTGQIVEVDDQFEDHHPMVALGRIAQPQRSHHGQRKVF